MLKAGLPTSPKLFAFEGYVGFLDTHVTTAPIRNNNKTKERNEGKILISLFTNVQSFTETSSFCRYTSLVHHIMVSSLCSIKLRSTFLSPTKRKTKILQNDIDVYIYRRYTCTNTHTSKVRLGDST